jgi:hypothetical protein
VWLEPECNAEHNPIIRHSRSRREISRSGGGRRNTFLEPKLDRPALLSRNPSTSLKQLWRGESFYRRGSVIAMMHRQGSVSSASPYSPPTRRKTAPAVFVRSRSSCLPAPMLFLHLFARSSFSVARRPTRTSVAGSEHCTRVYPAPPPAPPTVEQPHEPAETDETPAAVPCSCT